MTTLLCTARPLLSFQCARLIARTAPLTLRRALSTLPSNPHIVSGIGRPHHSYYRIRIDFGQYVHEQPYQQSRRYLLSYLSSTPPIASLAIGTTSQIPPTPETLTENHDFFQVLHWVIRENAVKDPDVQAQAAMYLSLIHI